MTRLPKLPKPFTLEKDKVNDIIWIKNNQTQLQTMVNKDCLKELVRILKALH